MSIKILPYKLGSKTAKDLAAILGVPRLHHNPTKSKFRYNYADLVYNYGNGNTDFGWLKNIPSKYLLNHPRYVGVASNKIKAFQALQQAIEKGTYTDIAIPDWTVSKAVAIEWAKEGHVVYCRQLTRASQGKGIVVAHNQEEVVSAPLFTKGIMNVKREYRAHVFKGEVIDLVAKAVEAGTSEDACHEIKSHANGWVFVRDAVKIPDAVKVNLVNTAIEAVEALRLDVAAVDLIRDNENNILILEVNTAPGMEGTTLDKYAIALREYDVKKTDEGQEEFTKEVFTYGM